MFTLAATVAILGGLLLFLAARWFINRWVAAGEKVEALADLGENFQPGEWHGHGCGCICTDKILPCDTHKGQAAAVLHQEAP